MVSWHMGIGSALKGRYSMAFKAGNDSWKSRKVNKGGRPRKHHGDAVIETSCVGVGDVAVESVVDDTVALHGDDVVDVAVVASDEDDGEGNDTPFVAHSKKARFLACFSEIGNVLGAAEASELSARMHYYWVKRDPAYREEFQTRKAMYSEKLIAAVHERAMREDKPSDLMMIFGLKGLRPEYRDNYRPADINVNVIGNDNKIAFNWDRFRSLLLGD